MRIFVAASANTENHGISSFLLYRRQHDYKHMLWLYNANGLVRCWLYMLVNCAQWTLKIESMFIALFLRVNCSRTNYVLADLLTQHLSFSTLPEFISALNSSSLALYTEDRFTHEENSTLKSLPAKIQITLMLSKASKGFFTFQSTDENFLTVLIWTSSCSPRGISFPALKCSILFFTSLVSYNYHDEIY